MATARVRLTASTLNSIPQWLGEEREGKGEGEGRGVGGEWEGGDSMKNCLHLPLTIIFHSHKPRSLAMHTIDECT